jgi:hypothetical protein
LKNELSFSLVILIKRIFEKTEESITEKPSEYSLARGTSNKKEIK